MEFSIKAFDVAAVPAGKTTARKANLATQFKTDCWVIGLFEGSAFTAAATQCDEAAQGGLSKIAKMGDITGKKGQTLLIPALAGVTAQRVLLVGLGKQDDFNAKAYSAAVKAALKALGDTKASQILFSLPEVLISDRDTAWAVQTTVQLARESAYRFIANFPQFKSKKETDPAGPAEIILSVAPAEQAAAKMALLHGVALANGMALTKDLGNLPGNICTPTYLADTAKKMAREFKLKVEILDEKQMQALKMGSLLSVGKGSAQASKFIVLQYTGASAKTAPVVLVGKGITFDTGGISLKPGAEMDEMKYDMCGAASVLGTIRAVAEMLLPVNLTVVVPAAENMPSDRASKPGDIVTSMSGQTIEILSTDAEGRLVLCDALTYSERFKPAAVVDVATLTGACIIALGHVNSGLFTKDDALAEALSKAGKTSLDTVWRMPLDEEYQEQLKSNFADMANIGGRAAGSVTAACFLARFTEKYRWAHLDIAGTAWKSGAAKGATGRPVPLLVEFVKSGQWQ